MLWPLSIKSQNLLNAGSNLHTSYFFSDDDKLDKDEFTTPLDGAGMTERDSNRVFDIVKVFGNTSDSHHVNRYDLEALFNRWDTGKNITMIHMKVM